MNHERLAAACGQSSILHRFIHDGYTWRPGYRKLLDRIDAACRAHQVCEHGETHHVSVIDNAFILKDHCESHIGVSIPDEYAVLAVSGHDAGYGLSRARWEETVALDHAAAGKKFSRKFWGMYGDPCDRLPDEAIIFSAMDGTTAGRLSDAREILKRPQPDAQTMLPIVIKLADGFDYFRRDRLEGIPTPSSFEKNPYYFLADAVSSYRLESDRCNKVLRYIPRMDRSVSFAWWCEQTQQHYGAVWELAHAFGAITRSRFEIQPERGV